MNGCDVELQKWNYVKLRDRNANNTILSLTQFFTDGKLANCVVEGQTTGINARLLDIVDGSEGNAPDYLTAFVSYVDSGANNTTKSFSDNEVVVFRQAVGNDFIAAANTITADSTGLGLGTTAIVGLTILSTVIISFSGFHEQLLSSSRLNRLEKTIHFFIYSRL